MPNGGNWFKPHPAPRQGPHIGAIAGGQWIYGLAHGPLRLLCHSNSPKFPDQFRHDVISLAAQAFNHACPVGLGTVLAYLPLAFHALNLDLKADYAPDL